MNVQALVMRIRRQGPGVALALAASLVMLGHANHHRIQAPQGLYLQAWSSETMVQTLPIVDLRDRPLWSLWHLHIQPPAFDALRALLAQCFRAADPLVMLWRVDYAIYHLWAVIYGLILYAVFHWLRRATGPGLALIATVILAFHPAMIYYANFLETTMPSAYLVLLLFYLLWRVRQGDPVSPVVLALAFLALYFTRSLFQVFWIPILAVSLLLLRYPLRRLAVFIVLTTVIVGLYGAKQVSQFGLYETSSFTGLNLCKSIGMADAWEAYQPVWAGGAVQPIQGLNVLNRTHKSTGSPNFNHLECLSVNRDLKQRFRESFQAMSAGGLLRAYAFNAKRYLRPSSRYKPNLAVATLPQRALYDRLFSGVILAGAVIGAAGICLWRTPVRAWPGLAGLALPGVALVLLCIVGERGENMRFKFFLEPTLYVWLVIEAHAVFANGIKGLRGR